jgi:hypothetical protein
MALVQGAANSKQYRVKIINFCGDAVTSTPVTVGICGETTTVAPASANDTAAATGQTVTISSAGITSGNYTGTSGFAYEWEVSTDGSNWGPAIASTGVANGNTLVAGAGGGTIAVPTLTTVV